MRVIKILGTGCPNCKRTEAVVRTVADELKCDVSIVKIEDIKEIMTYDIMSTPAVVIDEKVVIKGRVPNFDEIKDLLRVDNEDCCNESDSSCCSSVESSSADKCC